MVRSEGNMSLKNPVTPLGIDPGTVRLVAQRLNHYATSGPILYYLQFISTRGEDKIGGNVRTLRIRHCAQHILERVHFKSEVDILSLRDVNIT